MRPRITKGAPSTAADGCGRLAAHDRRATVVIADSGTVAEILVFPAGEPVATGAEFQYRGTTWVITGNRRDSGVLVAEPIAH